MAKKTENKDESEKRMDIPSQIAEAINAAAKLLGVAAVELWGIFVRQYVVRGANEAFTAIVLVVASYFLYPVIGLWILVPLAGALALLGNPKYYALEDISEKVKSYQKENLLKDINKKTYPFKTYK